MNTSRRFERRLRLLAFVAATSVLPAGVFGQTAPAQTNVKAEKDQAVQLEVFNVTDDRDLGYESLQTTSGMRTVQELKNLANSISIMNKTFMDDIGAITVDEVMRWSTSGEDNPEPLNVQ